MMKISVITVCYNAFSTIESTIISLIKQDYDNVEYIVIDGASNDGTTEIIKKYQDHISVYISEPDLGIYDAINKGIKLATGDVIGMLHANDCFASDNILSTIANGMEHNNADAVYGNLVFTNPHGKIVRKWKSQTCSRLLLELGWMPPHPTFYLKKSVYNKYGNYRLDFASAADYELIIRMLYRYKINTCYIDTIFVKMLTGGLSNKNILNHVTGNRNDFKAMKMHKLHAPFIAIILKPVQKIFQYL